MSVVVDLDRARVLHVADDRKVPYFEGLTETELTAIEAVGEPYRKVVRAHVPGADAKIVYDKFQVMVHLSNAVDEMWKRGHKALSREGDTRF